MSPLWTQTVNGCILTTHMKAFITDVETVDSKVICFNTVLLAATVC